MEKSDENILFSIIENKNKEIDSDEINISNELNQMLNELEINNTGSSCFDSFKESENMIKIIDYRFNYKLKDLYLICEYYDILKIVKFNKCNKEEVINVIVEFESDINNTYIVNKRKLMWCYINELKNDKVLKKFILL